MDPFISSSICQELQTEVVQNNQETIKYDTVNKHKKRFFGDAKLKKRKAIGKSLAPSTNVSDDVKPWLHDKQRRGADRRAKIIFFSAFGLGLIGAITMIAITALSVIKEVGSEKYCLLFEDNFDKGEIDKSIWSHELQTGGWGTGSFDWTTDSLNNSYVKDGKLYIVPTLTADIYGEAGMLDGVKVNLTEAGTCTASNKTNIACAAVSNATAGTILPPIQSARLTTKLSGKNIRYGKIEVTAKMPKGDWIWPAIWMMPVNNTYGTWPASGEIDIFESKGNPSRKHNDGLSSRMLSTLHWGPISELDAYKKTQGHHDLLRNFWTDSMHTFGLQWSTKRLVTWFGSRANSVLNYSFTKNIGGFWKAGDFPYTLTNGTAVTNPWTAANGVTELSVAPFDQEFYLILNVAVGSTNGFFSDGDSSYLRPWSDQSVNPAKDFWTAREEWLATWPKNVEDRAMIIDNVKVWQQC